jgi:hypothetical protein
MDARAAQTTYFTREIMLCLKDLGNAEILQTWRKATVAVPQGSAIDAAPRAQLDGFQGKAPRAHGVWFISIDKPNEATRLSPLDRSLDFTDQQR